MVYMYHASFLHESVDCGFQGELQRNDEDDLLFPQQSNVIQAAVVLIKEKSGKFQKLRVWLTFWGIW